jgi:glycosyltransferase involved in cell wall biosynthesis
MTNQSVSIIIPVYNIAPYLEHCLDSIISQTFKNLEIIIVNDCSTDGSGDIIKKYSQKDNRLKIIILKRIWDSATQETQV